MNKNRKTIRRVTIEYKPMNYRSFEQDGYHVWKNVTKNNFARVYKTIKKDVGGNPQCRFRYYGRLISWDEAMALLEYPTY